MIGAESKESDANVTFTIDVTNDMLRQGLAAAHLLDNVIKQMREKLQQKKLKRMALSFYAIWKRWYENGEPMSAVMPELIQKLHTFWKELAALGFVLHQSTIIAWEVLELARTPANSFSEKLFWYMVMKAYSARYGILAIALLRVAKDEESRRLRAAEHRK